MSYDNRYQRPGSRRVFYPPPPPPGRANQSHHSVFGYWLPLLVTGTIAIGGLAAWAWSERRDHDEDDYPHDKPSRPPPGVGGPYPPHPSQSYPGSAPPGQAPHGGPVPPYQGPPPSQSAGPQGGPPPVSMQGGEASSYYGSTRDTQQQDDNTWYGRVSGIVKRTPSPQQVFDQASKHVSAGIAAAGSALGSIVEEHDDEARQERRPERPRDRRTERRQSREVFSDHERWSEEADERQRTGAVDAASEKRADLARASRDDKGKGRAKRPVAVVVNADTSADAGLEQNLGYTTEHASILSHLPSHEASDNVDVFVLIYAPGLKSLPPLDYAPRGAGIPSAIGSLYSQVSTPAVTPGSELQSISPRIDAVDPPSKQFDVLYQQAQTVVSSPTHILPFTTPDGYVHILRHLAPNLAYVSDTLSGDEGRYVDGLKDWVGLTIIVAGDDGHGGLADTETEDEGNLGGREKRRWYDHSQLIGLGKSVEVVDAVRIGDDWQRRVVGRE